MSICPFPAFPITRWRFLRFAVRHGRRRGHASRRASMALTFTPEQEEFRLRLRAWLGQNLPPGWEAGDRPTFASYEAEVQFMRDWQALLYRGGWCGLSWPKEYGGGGASLVEQAIYNEEMARARAPELINKG